MESVAQPNTFKNRVVERPTIPPTIVARTNHFKTLIKRTDSSVSLLFILFTFTTLALPLGSSFS